MNSPIFRKLKLAELQRTFAGLRAKETQPIIRVTTVRVQNQKRTTKDKNKEDEESMIKIT